MQQVFPTWRYHRTHDPKVVHSADELAALGGEWKDSPAAFMVEAPIEAPQEQEAIEPEASEQSPQAMDPAKPKRGRKPKER
jgi:hypothetical protein